MDLTEANAPKVPAMPTGSELKLRAAMARLLGGKAQRTNGALSKNNLYLEAGVSRATMNRHPSIMAEWDQAVAAGRAPAKDLEREIMTKNAEIKRLRQEIRDLEKQVAAASTVIAAMFGKELERLEAKARKKRRKPPSKARPETPTMDSVPISSVTDDVAPEAFPSSENHRPEAAAPVG